MHRRYTGHCLCAYAVLTYPYSFIRLIILRARHERIQLLGHLAIPGKFPRHMLPGHARSAATPSVNLSLAVIRAAKLQISVPQLYLFRYPLFERYHILEFISIVGRLGWHSKYLAKSCTVGEPDGSTWLFETERKGKTTYMEIRSNEQVIKFR